MTAQRVLFCELCALKATFRGINYLPEAAAFRVRLTCTFNLRGRRGTARRRISPTCRGLQRCGPRCLHIIRARDNVACVRNRVRKLLNLAIHGRAAILRRFLRAPLYGASPAGMTPRSIPMQGKRGKCSFRERPTRQEGSGLLRRQMSARCG